MNLFGRDKRRKETNETISLMQAVKHIADALTTDEIPSIEAQRTVERTIETPRSWEGLLRTARSKEGNAQPCRS